VHKEILFFGHNAAESLYVDTLLKYQIRCRCTWDNKTHSNRQPRLKYLIQIVFRYDTEDIIIYEKSLFATDVT